MPKGQICKALSGFYYIDYKGKRYQTRARGNFRNRNITPLVGDWVEFESTNETDGYILDVYERKNDLVRPPVANIDQGVVVSSCVEPNFSTNLLDRFLVTLSEKDIDPIIYVTKMDLANEEERNHIAVIQTEYEKIGYPVLLAEKNSL